MKTLTQLATPKRLAELGDFLDEEIAKYEAEFTLLVSQESALEAKLAEAPKYSDRFWMTLSRLNIVRRQLVKCARYFKANRLHPASERYWRSA